MDLSNERVTRAKHADVSARVVHSNSRVFKLDYELEQIEATGIESVELWGSQDDGATWAIWGEDPDQRSPFEVEITTDGVYGFRVVVKGRNGLTSASPQAGDPPDMVIAIDSKAPELRIESLSKNSNIPNRGPCVAYHCADDNLMSGPLTMYIAQSANGPWALIESNIENTGLLPLPSAAKLPQRFYVRLDALDQAGNITTAISPSAFDLAAFLPRARIKDLQPKSPNASTPKIAVEPVHATFR